MKAISKSIHSLIFCFAVEEIVKLIEHITQNLVAKCYNRPLTDSITKLNIALKTHGNNLELFHRDFLDKAQVNNAKIIQSYQNYSACVLICKK